MCSECFKSKPAEAWRAIGFNKHLLAVIWRLSLIGVMKSSETLGDIPERSHTHQWNFPKRPPSPLAPQEGLLCRFQRYPQPPPSVWELEDLPCRSVHPHSGLLWTQHAPGWLTAEWQMLLLEVQGFAAASGSLTALLTALLWLKSQYKCSILGQYMQTSFNCGIWGCWDLQGSVWCCEISVCADPNTPHMPGFYLGGRWVELASSLL